MKNLIKPETYVNFVIDIIKAVIIGLLAAFVVPLIAPVAALTAFNIAVAASILTNLVIVRVNNVKINY